MSGYITTYIEQQFGIVARLKKRPGQAALPLECNAEVLEWHGEVRPLHEMNIPGDPAEFFISHGMHVFSFECEGNWIQYAIDPTKTKSKTDIERIASEWNDTFKTVVEEEYFCTNPACEMYQVPSSYDCECTHI